ncbi:DNA polymerase III subunit delta [Candidatus Latescibacterota bacterium]
MTAGNLSETRVVLLSGEEFQRQERISEILGEVVDESTRDFNLDTLYAEDYKNKQNELLTKLSELIMTFPMMSERRVIVVRDFDKLNKVIAKKASAAIQNTPETSFVLIEGEKAALTPKPKGYFIAEKFTIIYEDKLPFWVRSRFRKRGKTISESAIMHLINNAGSVLRELENEIAKITVVAEDRSNIDEEDVKKVVGAFKRDTIYGLSNAVGLQDFRESSRILHNLLEKEKSADDKKVTETYMISQLFSHVMKLSEYNRLIKTGVPQNEAMKIVIASPFLWNKNKMTPQARNLNPQLVRRMLTVFGRTESTIKRSSLDNKLLVEFMIPLIMPFANKVRTV